MTFAAMLVVAVVLVGSDTGRHYMRVVFESANGLISSHPRAGAIVFVALAALSAILAFFSSALLLPVAIFVWGGRTTFGLLWLGWFLGGLTSYAVGKYLGREVVRWVVPSQRLDLYERQLARKATFGRVLLFHLIVPSEMPGYILGILRYPLHRYLAVLAIAEIPFAAGAIYLGSSFVEGNLALFLVLGLLAAALSVLTTRWFLRHGGPHVTPITGSSESQHGSCTERN